MKKNTLYGCLIFFLISCQPDLDYKIKGYTQKIIVEGSIANGEFPRVYLSLNVPLSAQFNPDSIRKYIISNAKVVVSDSLNPDAVGAKTEILTAGWDTEKSPPHSYFGTDFKGEVGKTYYLTIIYSGFTLHAKTTIPSPVADFDLEATVINDSMRSLATRFLIDPAKKQSYLMYTKKSSDSNYLRTSMLYNNTLGLSGENRFLIEPTPTKKDSSFKEGGYYSKGDLIQLRLCSIDSTATQFYKELSTFSSSTGIGNEFFIGEKKALPSNVTLPGFGFWCGMGINQKVYQVP